MQLMQLHGRGLVSAIRAMYAIEQESLLAPAAWPVTGHRRRELSQLDPCNHPVFDVTRCNATGTEPLTPLILSMAVYVL